MSGAIRIEGPDVSEVTPEQIAEALNTEQLAVKWTMAMRDRDYSRAVDIVLDMLDCCTGGKPEPCPF